MSVASRLPDPRDLGRYYALAQVGLEMVAMVGLGIALDHYYGWTPWATIGGALLGLVGGVSHLVILAKQSERRKNGPRGPQREGA